MALGCREVGGFTQRAKMAQCNLERAVEGPCSEPGGLVFCMNGRRKQPCHLVGPLFQVLMAFICARAGWHYPCEYSLESGHGQVRELTRDGWLYTLRAVWSIKNRENWIWVCLMIHQLKNRSTDINSVYKGLTLYGL